MSTEEIYQSEWYRENKARQAATHDLGLRIIELAGHLNAGNYRLLMPSTRDTLISVDGVEVGRGSIARTARSMAGIGETFDTGRDTNVAVTDEYADGGDFTGTINRIEVNVKPPAMKPSAGAVDAKH